MATRCLECGKKMGKTVAESIEPDTCQPCYDNLKEAGYAYEVYVDSLAEGCYDD